MLNAAVSVVNITTKATVGGSDQLTAGNNVLVTAQDQDTINSIAGNIAAAGTAAVGAAVAVPVVTKDVE